MLTVTLITHPNRLGPDEPSGFRFAVHVTEGDTLVDPTDLASVVNAGWRPTIEEADLDGQDQAETALGALQRAGLEVHATTITGTTDYHPPA